ncbi:hypothetical protein TrVE_jg14202 [Triparma verrucosa]|uniref:Uncharacterized protein n=2 Tax=Triparma TaxID=722752 RepID=A0A9W7AGJ3_9STRA|nr:hypothetical protein TrST_g4862 [Triparma strigata]GMH85063.1 hypothetical protein TrVE_jg14202 [Triparma verrucosa]
MRGYNLLVLVFCAILALTSLTPSSSFVSSPVPLRSHSSTFLSASRVNAKKEKRLRNKDNMRKFQRKRGSSRRRLMKKVASNAARQGEMEFVAKLFQHVEGPAEPEIRDDTRRSRR